jgi:hypothetical protein
LNGHAHLTPDHAHGICGYIELLPAETEYFLALVEHARSGSASYRKYIESKLKRLKKENEDISERLGKPAVESTPHEVTYFSSWHWSAIHLLVSIPEYQDVSSISEKLRLPSVLVKQSLETLAQMGLVRIERGRWIYATGNRHIPNHSPLIGLHHGNWRQRALLDVQQHGNSSVHYTMIQTMSPRALEQIKTKLLNFIEESNAIAGPSESKKLVCVATDLFEIE